MQRFINTPVCVCVCGAYIKLHHCSLAVHTFMLFSILLCYMQNRYSEILFESWANRVHYRLRMISYTLPATFILMFLVGPRRKYLTIPTENVQVTTIS